eukprot:GDKH01006177.1.p1 GENE.GDKH01006177.1~~GDKH01006177.1.p1  ORF type:complete len:168 (-),score=38.03 GDKH01006177.1:104-607(-)
MAKPAFSEDDLQEMLLCARYGEVDDLKEYISKGADVDFTDKSGNTALHMASANGHVDVVRVLLEHGAKSLKNKTGNTPLHWATQNKQQPVVEVLLNLGKDVDVLARNEFGRGALTEAFDAGNGDVTKKLLEHKSAAVLEEEAAKAESAVNEEDAEAAGSSSRENSPN